MFIASSPNLPAAENRFLFDLKFGSHKNKELQEDIKNFGAQSFSFFVLDELKSNPEPDSDYEEDLKILEEMWLEKIAPFGEKGYNRKKD